MNLQNIDIGTVILALGAICGAVSQLAAMFGSPKISSKATKAQKALAKATAVLAGNYGKAKNVEPAVTQKVK